MASVRLVNGKAEFVRRKLSSGKLEEVCLCKHNVDFSIRGCISQVHGSLIKEVIQNKGAYREGNIKKYRELNFPLDNRCLKCYAKATGGGNWGKITPKEINEKTVIEFEGKKPEIIRLGKSTECGHSFYRKTLINFLELCREFETRVIFPNKMLEFDKRVSRLLFSNSVINKSITYDGVILEPGVISQGYDNKERIKEALKYFWDGINTTLTITCDVTGSFEENAKRTSAIYLALEAYEKYEIPIRLLPLRINSKKLCGLITGKKWGEIVCPKGMETQENLINHKWRYYRKSNNEAYPAFLHKDFQKLVDSGVGVCGTVGDLEYCDKCNLEGETRIQFPISEIPKMIYTNKGKRFRTSDRKTPKQRDKNQLSFEF